MTLSQRDRLIVAALVCFAIACAIGAVLMSGCSPAVRAAHARPDVTDSRGIIWNDSRCFELLNAADNWTFAAKLLVGTGGTAAVAAPVGGAISSDAQEQARIGWGLGISAAISSGAGLAALWMGEKKRDEFEEYCQTEAVRAAVVPEHPAADEVDLDGGVR